MRTRKRGTTSASDLIFHVFVQDSAQTDGRGLGGKVYSDFTVYYIRSGEAESGSITPQDITTIGTYVAPTANTNCRIKQVDATHMLGVYELQLHQDWLAVTNTPRSITIYLSVTGGAVLPLQIQLDGNAVGEIADGGISNATFNSDVGITAYATNKLALACDKALLNSNLDHVAGTASGIPTIPAGTWLDMIMCDGSATYNRITHSLQAIKDNTAAPADVAALILATPANKLVTDASGLVGLTATESILMRTGTAQAGAASTITLDSEASASDNFYRGAVIRIVSGTGAGQGPRMISSYVGSTKVATVDASWVTNPASGSVFSIYAITGPAAAGDPLLNAVPGGYGAGTAGYVLGHNIDALISSRLAPTVAGRTLDVSANGEAGIDWANIGSPTTTVGLTGTSVVNPLASAVPGAFGAGTAGYVLGTNLDVLVSSRLAPTVAARTLDVSAGGEAGIDWANVGSPTTTVGLSGTTVADVTTKTGFRLSATGVDDIYDEPSAAHNVAGSMGLIFTGMLDTAISSRAAAATALSTAVWTGGRAGYLDYLDAAVSTRATPAQVNAQVLDVLNVDTWAMMAQGEPTATPTAIQMMMYNYMAIVNPSDVVKATGTMSHYNPAGTTCLFKRTVTDDGATFYRGKMVTGA